MKPMTTREMMLSPEYAYVWAMVLMNTTRGNLARIGDREYILGDRCPVSKRDLSKIAWHIYRKDVLNA